MLALKSVYFPFSFLIFDHRVYSVTPRFLPKYKSYLFGLLLKLKSFLTYVFHDLYIG